MQTFTLEKSPYFKYVAWGTIICFSFFVFHLISTVSANIAQLEQTAATTNNPGY